MTRPLIGINTDHFEEGGKPVYSTRAEYIDAVCKAGGMPWIFPCINDKDLLNEYMDRLDGFVFMGGKDYPPQYYAQEPHHKTQALSSQRAETDIELVKMVLERKMPVLGICAGCQLLNIAFDGKLIQHLETAHDHTGDGYHDIQITKGRILSALFGEKTMPVNSTHHQAIDPDALGNSLTIVARADDGTVEAVESTEDRFLLGVQWHPERINDLEHKEKIFTAFVNAAKG